MRGDGSIGLVSHGCGHPSGCGRAAARPDEGTSSASSGRRAPRRRQPAWGMSPVRKGRATPGWRRTPDSDRERPWQGAFGDRVSRAMQRAHRGTGRGRRTVRERSIAPRRWDMPRSRAARDCAAGCSGPVRGTWTSGGPGTTCLSEATTDVHSWPEGRDDARPVRGATLRSGGASFLVGRRTGSGNAPHAYPSASTVTSVPVVRSMVASAARRRSTRRRRSETLRTRRRTTIGLSGSLAASSAKSLSSVTRIRRSRRADASTARSGAPGWTARTASTSRPRWRSSCSTDRGTFSSTRNRITGVPGSRLRAGAHRLRRRGRPGYRRR